ncbi:YceI family protein [Algibacter sp. 2305UL17-15]|uniref:YceI family protein n=1 Tax=Algibacter sp. 2305UL17-15 TaxID=3231268 RepID=UPI003457C546
MKKLIMLAVFGLTFSVNAQMKLPIDTNKSMVKWTGSNLFKFNKHYGTVTFRNGTIVTKGNKLIGGNFMIDMSTIINTDGKYNEMLVNHLKGAEFFAVDRYPNAKLEIVEAIDKGKNTFDVLADLTIKHIKNKIRFSATITNSVGKSVMNTKFIIDRTLWNIVYKTKGILSTFKNDTISDAIEFEVSIEWVNDDKC